MSGLLASIDDIVYGRALAGLAAVVILFELAVSISALRRQRSGQAPLSSRTHAIAGAVIAALPVALGFSVHAARRLMLDVYFGSSVDPGEKAAAISRGLAGQMNAIPLGVSSTLLALGLWFAGTAYTLSKRRPERSYWSFPPILLVPVGLLGTAIGALEWSTGMIKTFAAMAGLPPEEKSAIVEQQLDVARGELTAYAWASVLSIAALAVIAVFLTVSRARSGVGGETPARPRATRLTLAVSAAALALAGLLMLAARPLAAENDLRWPPATVWQFVVRPGGPVTPDVVGPDAPERGPVVTVSRDSVRLDGAVVDDLTDLELKLGTLANNFKLLHPGQDFDELALIQADKATPSARLASVLRAVRGAWYYRPMFAFTVTETHARPMFGKLERVVVTGARFRLAFTEDEPEDDWGEWKTVPPVPVERFADYGALARHVVELRRAGKPVLVTIPQSAR